MRQKRGKGADGNIYTCIEGAFIALFSPTTGKGYMCLLPFYIAIADAGASISITYLATDKEDFCTSFGVTNPVLGKELGKRQLGYFGRERGKQRGWWRKVKNQGDGGAAGLYRGR